MNIYKVSDEIYPQNLASLFRIIPDNAFLGPRKASLSKKTNTTKKKLKNLMLFHLLLFYFLFQKKLPIMHPDISIFSRARCANQMRKLEKDTKRVCTQKKDQTDKIQKLFMSLWMVGTNKLMP